MLIINHLYNLKLKRKLPNIKNFKIGKLMECTGGEHIYFGDNFKAGMMFRIEAIDNYLGEKYNPKIEIGNNADFGQSCHVGCINHIKIGENCLLGSKVLIIDHNHGSTSENIELPPGKRKLISKGPICIGDNVWIGDGAVILGNVSIGDNVIIGANSVVCKNVPSNCVIAGVPSKVIKKLKV